MLKTMDGLNIGLPSFTDEVRKAGHEVVPIAWTMAQPAGAVTAHAFERMAATLVDGYRRSNADVIFCELHGAMVADDYDDAEGELLRRIRAVVGPNVPVVGTLDLHVNMSDTMVEKTNFLTAYRTYPHVDWGDTGRRVARWLDRILSWGPNPGKAMRRMPFLIPITAGCSLISPVREIYALLEQIEAETGVHLSFVPGFPPADIADCGPAVFGYGADQATVDRAVDRLTEAVNAAEPAFAAQRVQPVAEAVANAIRISQDASKPVVLADTQDNPGAGGNGDTTGVLKELIRQNAQEAVLGMLIDPASAQKAHQAGLGSSVVFSLGGRSAIPGDAPLAGEFTVERLGDGRFTCTGPMYRGARMTLGPMALLRSRAAPGVRVVLASRKQQAGDQEMFRHVGIEPRRERIVALKSSVHFRADFEPIAKEVLVVKSPGPALADPTEFQWTKLRKGVRLRPLGPVHA
jgi:microcystin degradation protein MlrC